MLDTDADDRQGQAECHSQPLFVVAEKQADNKYRQRVQQKRDNIIRKGDGADEQNIKQDNRSKCHFGRIRAGHFYHDVPGP